MIAPKELLSLLWMEANLNGGLLPEMDMTMAMKAGALLDAGRPLLVVSETVTATKKAVAVHPLQERVWASEVPQHRGQHSLRRETSGPSWCWTKTKAA